MFVYRFMSNLEFVKYINKEDLINDSKHIGSRTDSVGFCFGKCDTEDLNMVTWYPTYYLQNCLSSIVSEEVCCIFEVDERILKKGYGIYADPDSDDFFASITVDEYSTIMYNYKTLKLVKYCTKIDWFKSDWEWINYEGFNE